MKPRVACVVSDHVAHYYYSYYYYYITTTTTTITTITTEAWSSLRGIRPCRTWASECERAGERVSSVHAPACLRARECMRLSHSLHGLRPFRT